MKIFDISPEVSSELGVFPEDTPYSREILMDIQNGDALGLSKITTTLHIGAHVDAPNHYCKSEKGIGERSLHYYLGPAQVISAKTQKGQRVKIEDLETQEIQAPRILIKTNSFPDPNRWNSNFCSLSPELVEFLAEKHVLLVGIDTPSIDPEQDKVLEAHTMVAKYNMAILEGIILNEVPDGLYQLHALPLKLKGADASPVRAILINNES